MKLKLKKTFIFIFSSISVISLALLFGCGKADEERLNESICVLTKDECTRIFSRGAKLPASFSDTFSNSEPEQKSVQITLYQGEDSRAESNRLIGRFEMPIKQVRQAGEARIQVTIVIDQSKKLTIVAKDSESGEQKEILGGIVN